LTEIEAISTLEDLNPVKYNYKFNKDEKNVRFIVEDVPDLVAIESRKGLSSMDITAVLVKVVQQQRKEIAAMQKRLKKLVEN